VILHTNWWGGGGDTYNTQFTFNAATCRQVDKPRNFDTKYNTQWVLSLFGPYHWYLHVHDTVRNFLLHHDVLCGLWTTAVLCGCKCISSVTVLLLSTVKYTTVKTDKKKQNYSSVDDSDMPAQVSKIALILFTQTS
jgi:hypothetical protein